MDIDRDVTICAHGEHGLWIISFEAHNICKPPSEDLWNWFQAIAKNLLLVCAGLGLTPALTPTPALKPKPEPASEAPEFTFPDENLEAAIRDALGKPVGEKIIAVDPVGLTILVADNKGISDLSGLEHCTSLTTLKLWENQISDISPLSNLTSLTSLTLDVNQISDIAPLANLTSLTSLLLSENHIRDISPLANLTSLTLLSLGANQISDISPLVENSGLGAGDEVWLLANNLDLGEGSEDMENIRALEDRGVVVHCE
jgi:Leucine-rich repeat (LRR) protein